MNIYFGIYLKSARYTITIGLKSDFCLCACYINRSKLVLCSRKI